MCGVPVHAAEGYLARLIKAGCRVAIAEQVESPEQARRRGGSKALVARDIVRFVTAGTLTEEALLEPRRANVLAAVCDVRGACGIAACDISTGRMELEECAPRRARRGARAARRERDWSRPRTGPTRPPRRSPRPRRDFASDEGEARLKAVHGVATLDGFGQFSRRDARRGGRAASPISTMPGAAGCRCCCRRSRAAARRHTGDGRGDPRQPRDPRGAGRRPRRQPDRRGRPLRHRRRRAPARRGPRRAARRREPRSRRGSTWSSGSTTTRCCAATCARCCARCPTSAARSAGSSPGAASPRDLGQVRDGLAEARRIHDYLARPARQARAAAGAAARASPATAR